MVNQYDNEQSNVAHNIIVWRSRRGMLELDLVLCPFAQQVYGHLSQADKQRYQQLLSCEDPDLFAWLVHKKQPTDPDLLKIVQRILDSAS